MFRPTNRMRWIERTVEVTLDNNGFEKHIDHLGNLVTTTKVTTKVLQQRWEENYPHTISSAGNFYNFEWRDIPLEKET